MTFVSDAAISRLRAVAAWPEFTGPRYEVAREIGRGGMGTVYLGRDLELSRDVAIKVTSGTGAGGTLVMRMRSEARILAALEHPGIVPIHDVGTLADGRLFTVMKLVRGVTLAERLRATPDPTERLRLFERICEPVAFAHVRGMVHRDLKPTNVMVGAFGEVLVMDWGVAKRIGQRDEGEGGAEGEEGEEGIRTSSIGATDPGTVLGTPGYMAPEQSAGRSDVDARADVHGLGGILYVMITDREPPEHPGGAVELLARHRGASRRLRAICAKAMAASPADRYADAAALGEDVARLRDGLPVVAYPETPLDLVARNAVRYRTPILLVATYLIIRAFIAAVFGR